MRCGFGYDSDIICKTPQSLKNKFGYLSYFIAGILFALKLKKREYEIVINNETLCTNASCIILANAANMYKNLVSVADNSEPDDGLIDIFILKTTNPLVFLYEFIRLIINKRKNDKNTEYLKTNKLSIKSSPSCCHIDGEKKFFKNTLTLSVLEKSINVLSR